MMDEPDALVNIKVEFDMRASKKDRSNFCQFSHKKVCIIITVKLGNKERFDKEQIGIKELFMDY